MESPLYRPSRADGLALSALLGQRGTVRSVAPTSRRESLADVLGRSLPKTLQEVLAEGLGVEVEEPREPEAEFYDQAENDAAEPPAEEPPSFTVADDLAAKFNLPVGHVDPVTETRFSTPEEWVAANRAKIAKQQDAKFRKTGEPLHLEHMGRDEWGRAVPNLIAQAALFRSRHFGSKAERKAFKARFDKTFGLGSANRVLLGRLQ